MQCSRLALAVCGALLLAGLATAQTPPAAPAEEAPAARAASGGVPAQVPAAAEPPVAGGPAGGGAAADATVDKAVDKAVDAARRAATTFREAVLGQSLIVGIARTDPELTIHPGTDIAVSVEMYQERGVPAPSIAFVSPSAELLTVSLGKGVSITPFALNATANYASFSARQSQQLTSFGTTAQGRVRGDYLLVAGQLNQWLLWEGERLPGGLHVWVGLGAGLLRFKGDFAYAVEGADYVTTIQNDGLHFATVQTGGLELRLRNFVLSGAAVNISRNGTSGSKAYLSYGGRRIADYTSSFVSRVYTLGYVFLL